MSVESINPSGFCECGCGGRAPIAKKTYRPWGYIAGQPVRFLAGHHRHKTAHDYEVDEATGCWVWQRSRAANGYGLVWAGAGKWYGAHRVYYERYRGSIPAGLCIDHLCGNRACVNPAHLEAVTRQENSRRGAAPRRKLTEAKVKEIRRLAADGATHRALAKRFGVSRWTVADALTRRTWAHV